MPIFLIERNYAEQLEITREGASAINLINENVGVNWLISFLSADKKKSYCLHEAPSVEAIREAAVRAGLPADVTIEVGAIHPSGDVRDVEPSMFA
jgi:Nickel responsive protein SCO4226-like